jgi:hypothetical protein
MRSSIADLFRLHRRHRAVRAPRCAGTLSFAKTPSGGQVIDLSALIMPTRQFHGLPSDSCPYTLTCLPIAAGREAGHRPGSLNATPICHPGKCPPGSRAGTAIRPGLLDPPAGRGWVERWRARCSVRWRSHSFRRGPQSGSHGDVSSAPLRCRASSFPQHGSKPRCVAISQALPARAPKLKCQVHIPSGASRFDLTFVADVPPADYRWHYQPARLRLTAATTLAHGPFAPSGL